MLISRCIPLFVASLIALGTSLAQDATHRPPNVIIIFTDDQGYQDLGSFGAPKIKTPHLDQMAKEGRRFTSFYSANSVCSPSRAALLTGCYPTRVNVPGVLFPRHREGLNPDETTIADMVKSSGYATACIGKWHLGHLPPLLPTFHGFDQYYGIPYSNDMKIDPTMALSESINLREGMTVEKLRSDEPSKNWVPILKDTEVIEYPADQTTLTKRYTEHAIQFIETNKDKPFFLYMPHTMPHIPLAATPEFRGKSAGGFYGDTIEEIDWSVGQVLDTLRKHQLQKNTWVIYASDNGPWKLKNGHGGSALPLRGYKFSTYEGGMRVPCIMWWPGKIPSDSVCDEVASTIDLLPTIAEFTGAQATQERIIDGKNIAPLVLGKEGAKSPHEAYYYYKNRRLESVRSGKWKLRRQAPKKNEPNAPRVELYDLNADISETTNLADKHPELVAKLLAGMDTFDKKRLADADARAIARPPQPQHALPPLSWIGGQGTSP